MRVLVSAIAILFGATASAAMGADRPALKPGDSFKDCEACPRMVVVPPGSFVRVPRLGEQARGDDTAPPQTATIAKAFAVGKFEVSFAQWAACVADRGCGGYRPYDWGWGRGTRPVIMVSWDDARRYVAWLSRKTRKQYRLLSEAEWDYAARAGTLTAYHWGDDANDSCAHANVADQTLREFGSFSPIANCRDGHAFTAPVGRYRPNQFGLHDMMGNVWEWTEDCWNDSHAGAPTDGSARTSGECGRRVARGGSSKFRPVDAGSYFWLETGSQSSDVGFRVARTL